MRSDLPRSILSITAAFMLTGALFAQTFQWEAKTSMPAPRWGASTFVINGKAYVLCGRSGATDHTQMWQYDPVENSWTPKASLPAQGRRLATAFSANGHGFIGCGITGSSTYLSDLWKYDPVADSWTQAASFPPGPRYNTWQFVLNGIAYVGGGNSGGASGPFHDDAYQYNPITNTWSTGYAIPDQGRHGAIGFTLNGRGYVVCGRENSLQFIQDFWCFDPLTNSWNALQSFAGSGRSSPLVFTYYNDVVVGCGRDGSINYYDAYIYEPTTNSWATIPDYPGATAMAGTSFSIGNRSFGGLGWDLATDLSHSDLWELVKPDQTAISEANAADVIHVHPNPADGMGFRIVAEKPGSVNATLISSDGRVVRSWSFNGMSAVPQHEITPGAYILQWRQNGSVGTIKVIMQ